MQHKLITAAALAAGLAVALLGAGCATVPGAMSSPAQPIAQACTAYAGALQAATPWKSHMSAATVAAIVQSETLANSVCATATPPADIATALNELQAATAQVQAATLAAGGK